MDKGRGDFPPRRRMNVGTLIASAFPRHPIKHIETALGCTPRQAQRIVETGKSPSRFQAALRKILLAAMEANNRALERHIEALRAGDYAEMVQRAADRRAQADRTAAVTPVGQADREATDAAVDESFHD